MALITSMEATCSVSLRGKRKRPQRRSFEELFLETVDCVFVALGESGKQVIYDCLENNYGITRESIPQNIGAFARMLEDIFGQGARLIEIRIMRALHDSARGFKYFPGQEELSFEDYVEALRRCL